MLNRKSVQERLAQLGACAESIAWIEAQPPSLLTIDLWAAAQHEWLLWLAGWLARDRTDHKTIVLAACACAASVLHLVPAGEDRPRVAIETARAWVCDEATISHVRAAANAAAAYAADAYAAAAYAAANAAYAADAASRASAAYAAANATYAAKAAYAAAYADAATCEGGNKIADIVRAYITAEWLDERLAKL